MPNKDGPKKPSPKKVVLPATEAAQAALKNSGFPFQTSVTHVLDKSPFWELLGTEVPWTDPGGKDQFIDAVGRNGDIYVVVEVKKMENAALTFLRPAGTGVARPTDIAVLACSVKNAGQQPPVATFWARFRAKPQSYVSELCVLAKSQGPEKRLLEADAWMLVQATNWVAQKEGELLGRLRTEGKLKQDGVVYVPILVTNAELFSAQYSADDVDLKTGRFSKDPTLEPIEWLRFTKSFSAKDNLDSEERTVFVVHSASFATFLSWFGVTIGAELNEPGSRPIRLRWRPGPL